MKVDLKPNEVVIKATNTNHQFVDKRIKGKLIITNQRIYFKAVQEDLSKFDVEILPEEIKEVHYFNTFKLIPNGLSILMKNGEQMQFTLKSRNEWGEMINKMY